MENKKIRSIARADSFYDTLEQYLKRFTPSEFIPQIASFLIKNIRNYNKIRYFPPHVLFSLLDANCAYYRPNYPQIQINDHWLKKLCNHFNNYEDPYIKYLLEEEKDIFRFLVTFAKKQFIYQLLPNENQFVRAISLINDKKILKESENEINKKYGFTLENWVFLCFCLVTLINRFPDLKCHVNNLNSNDIPEFPKSAVIPFLNEIGITKENAKEEYFNLRKEIPSFLHNYLPSVFEQHPVLLISNEYFSPLHPYLIMKKCFEGIFDLIIKLNNPKLVKEFSVSFEKYIYRLIEILKPKIIICENEIKDICGGKSADFIIEIGNSYIIIECKASRMSCNIPTKNALANDNITNKIANAFIQISNTAIEIKKGSFTKLDPKKRLMGICIIFGDMEFANNEVYIDEYVLKKLTTLI